MAHKLDVPVSTVQGWKQRDAIPENRAADILAAARSHDVDLSGIGEAASADDNDGADNVEADADTGPDLPAPTPSPVIERADRGVGGDRGAFIIAVIALIVAVGVGGWTLLGRGTSTDPAVQGDIAEITDRLENLETNAQSGASDAAQRQFAADLAELRAELDRMAAGLDEISAPSADVGELESRLRATEAQLGQVQRKAANDAQAATTAISAAQDEIAQMRTQLATLGENSTSTDQDVTGAVGLALAAGRLQRAMDNGAPYQDILEDLRSLSPGDDTLGAILDRLAEQAATGAPTRDVLAQTFAGVARDVIDAAGIQSAGGWTDRTLQRLRSIASIRRVGLDVSGDGPDARVARAEAKLLGGDLAGAVAELDGLTDAAAATAAPWLKGAHARLAADAAVGEIEALAIARVQAGTGGS